MKHLTNIIIATTIGLGIIQSGCARKGIYKIEDFNISKRRAFAIYRQYPEFFERKTYWYDSAVAPLRTDISIMGLDATDSTQQVSAQQRIYYDTDFDFRLDSVDVLISQHTDETDTIKYRYPEDRKRMRHYNKDFRLHLYNCVGNRMVELNKKYWVSYPTHFRKRYNIKKFERK